MENDSNSLRGVLKWTCIFALFCVLGWVGQSTQQNIWIEANAKFLTGSLGWFLISVVLDFLFPSINAKNPQGLDGIFLPEWDNLRFRQKIWESFSWSFLMLMFRYGYQLGEGEHPTLNIWNSIIIGVLGYCMGKMAESVLKSFKCPRCKFRFFLPNKSPQRQMIFDPSLNEWPNDTCPHCGLKLWEQRKSEEVSLNPNPI